MSELITALIYGSLSVTHPCALTSLSAVLALLHRTPKGVTISFFFGFIISQLVVGSTLQWGMGSAVGKAFYDLAQVLIGPILILIGMSFCRLLNWKAPNINFKRFGHLGLGAMLGIQLCPSSSLFFIGVFLPLSLNSSYPILMLCFYVTGATSFIYLLNWGLKRGLRWWSPLEKSLLWGQIMGVILIVLGLYFSFRKGLF